MNTPDPFTPMQAAAGQLHELFLTLINGGFTEDQAVKIVVGVLGEAARS